MRVAILAVTKNGVETGKKIADILEEETTLYVNKKFSTKGVETIDGSLADFMGELFQTFDALVFVMAVGIVVRSISGYVKDKRTDPAVVVVDEMGKQSISLLSGHLGGANDLANLIAKKIGAKAVVTTATDIQGKPSVEDLAKVLRLEIKDFEKAKAINAAIVNGEKVGIFSDFRLPFDLKDNLHFYNFSEINAKRKEFDALVIITNKKVDKVDAPHIILRPKNLLIGIGSKKGISKNDVLDAIHYTLNHAGLSVESVKLLATADFKSKEEGIIRASEELGVPLKAVEKEKIKEIEDRFDRSTFVQENVGVGAVSEPAAVLAGENTRLVQKKIKRKGVTIAIAEEGKMVGRILLVGIGPGNKEHMTQKAVDAIKKADVVVGYGTYLALIEEFLDNKEVISKDMTQEVERAKTAIKKAEEGMTVAVVCSGDPGVYAMASVVYEYLKEKNLKIYVEVIPGVTSANASAAILGSPLGHDFAVISLSDLLTPWEAIEKRLKNAAESNFVIVLYNPKSKKRQWQIERAREILLRYKDLETPVGIVKNAMREGEAVVITSLGDMLSHPIDMLTTVIIGNSETFVYDGKMITPRGYKRKYDLGG
ncbi:MAG: precorrin-3B C(17)-methyltransferase [Candidatus Hydrothermarchaeales archaeon]